jgi:hypothetical protein
LYRFCTSSRAAWLVGCARQRTAAPLAGVAIGNLRAIAAPPVNDGLRRHALAAGQPTGEILRQADGQQGLLPVYHLLHVLLAVQHQHLRKGLGGGQPLHQLDGCCAAILIEHRQRAVFHFQRGGEGKQQQLQQHRGNQQATALRRAQQRLHFLANQSEQTLPHLSCHPVGAVSARRSAPARRRRTAAETAG